MIKYYKENQMSLNRETIVVESITQYGVRSGGKNYGLSPKLKDQGVEPSVFTVGKTYTVEVWTGPKGGKSINTFVKLDSQPAAPSLPLTTVHETPAPGGAAPIAPATKVEPAVRVWVDENVMTKADWGAKDRSISIDAVIKSTLESPALAQLVVGKNQEEAFQTSRDFIKYNLETQRLAKEGSL